MSKEKISLSAVMDGAELRSTTQEMLKIREDYEYINKYDGKVQPKSRFVKDNYVDSFNRDTFNKSFEEKLDTDASLRIYAIGLIFQVFALIAYIAFFIVYPKTSEVAIEDGWLFIIPLAIIVATPIFALIDFDSLNKILMIGFVIFGIIIPILSVFSAIFASESTGQGDTACVIAYFVALIPAIVVPVVLFLTTKKSIIEKLRNKPKYVTEYNDGFENAKLKDEEDAEELRKEDEETYQYHVDMMSKKDDILEEWSIYEELYLNWCSQVSTIALCFPKVLENCYTDNQRIEKCSHLIPYNTGKCKISDHIISIFDLAKEKNASIIQNEALIDEIASDMAELLTKK